MIVVSNSSPLIALARIQRLDLLPAIFESLLIPPAVAREIAERTGIPPTQIKLGIAVALIDLATLGFGLWYWFVALVVCGTGSTGAREKRRGKNGGDERPFDGRPRLG